MAANPSEPALMNNLAFALANLGRIAEAEDVISNVDETKVTGLAAITLTATNV